MPPPQDSSIRGPDKHGMLAHITGSFAARGVGVVAGFIMHVLLSRLLGADGAGLFYLALTLLMAGGVIGKFGLDTALLRFAGAAAQNDDLATVRGLYRQACQLSLALSAGVAVCLYLAAPWLAEQLFSAPKLTHVLRIFAVAVIPFSLIWVQSGVLKAIGRPAAATMVEAGLLPVLMTALLGALAISGRLTAASAALAYVAGCLLACAFGAWIYARSVGRGPRGPGMSLARTSWQLALIDLMNFALAWATFPILGAVATTTDVGIFNTAHRLTVQINTVLVVFGGIMSPRMAARHAAGDLAGLEALAARTTLAMAVLAGPVCALFLIWPDILILIFGAEFDGGQSLLRVLTIGAMLNLFTGPAGYVLVMSGHQQSLRRILLFTVFTALPLTWWLGRAYGGLGVAIGASAGIGLQSVLAVSAVHRHLGIIGIPLLRRLHTSTGA